MERVYHHKMLDICRSEWSIIPAPDYMHNVHFWSKFFRDPGITQISENHPHLSLVQSHCLHTTYFLILNAYYGRFQGHNGFIHLKETFQHCLVYLSPDNTLESVISYTFSKCYTTTFGTEKLAIIIVMYLSVRSMTDWIVEINKVLFEWLNNSSLLQRDKPYINRKSTCVLFT